MNETTGTLVRLLARPAERIDWGILTDADVDVVRLFDGDRIVADYGGGLRGTIVFKAPLWYLQCDRDRRLRALELLHTRAVRLVEPADGGSVTEAKAEPPLVLGTDTLAAPQLRSSTVIGCGIRVDKYG